MLNWNSLSYQFNDTPGAEDLILGYLDALRTYAPGFLAEHGVSLRLMAADRANDIRMSTVLTDPRSAHLVAA